MTRKDVLELLHLPSATLRRMAHAQRMQSVGSHVFVRGLVEFSSLCRRNCLYCGLQRQNTAAHRYCLSKREILASAQEAYDTGVDTFVLQSGEWERNPLWLADIVATLKESFGLAVTLSVGECPKSHYALWKDAGADRFLLRHETADAALYTRLHPGYTLQDRLRCLRELKELGYETGSGFIVGLPGQTLETLADDVVLAQDLDVAMCGIGPFVPQANTPLAHVPHGDVELTLRLVSVLRLALPHAHLPATTALASLDPGHGQRDGLAAGANVLMPSFTPQTRRRDYAIYDNKRQVDMQDVLASVEGAGLTHTLLQERAARKMAARPTLS